MSKATQGNKNGRWPEVIRFKARLVRQAEAKNGSAMRLEVPKVVGRKLRGMDKLEGTMSGHPFRVALEAGASGGRRLEVQSRGWRTWRGLSSYMVPVHSAPKATQ